MEALINSRSPTGRWVVALCVVLGSLLGGPPCVQADDWDGVMRLKPGAGIRVHLEPAGRKTGPFVRADALELTVEVRNVHEVISRDRIRRVDRDRALARAAPWIGMVIGGAAMALSLKGESDFTAFGHTMWFGIGASIGATGGAVVRRATRFSPIYPSPPPVRFVVASASTERFSAAEVAPTVCLLSEPC